MPTQPPGATHSARPREAVIGLLLGEDSPAIAASEIAQRTEFAIPVVARELRILVQAGVLLAEEIAGRMLYRANPADASIGELRAIALRTRAVNDRLSRALAGLAGIELAFVIGAPAAGGAAAAEGIELMVIGDIEYAAIKDAIAMAAADLGRPVNLLLHGRSHWQLKLFEGDKFFRRVAFGPKVFLAGSQAVLDRVGKSRKARPGGKR